jgi:hypothetical protein
MLHAVTPGGLIRHPRGGSDDGFSIEKIDSN